MAKNVLGGELYDCAVDPVTGWYRDGACNTGPGDYGLHIVCVVMTEEFLRYSLEVGNDLSNPNPQYRFPGLKPGDRWCLSAARWIQAMEAGVAPPVVLEATNAQVLDWISLDNLETHRF